MTEKMEQLYRSGDRFSAICCAPDHDPFGATKIFIVLASRSRSKAAGAASMPGDLGSQISDLEPSIGRREIISANSSTYAKQPCTRSSLTRIVSRSSPDPPGRLR